MRFRIYENDTDRSRRIQKSIKHKLYKKLGGCQICGEGTIGGSRHDKILEVHHYVSRCMGGSDGIENSVLLCRPCHVDVHNNKIESPRPMEENNVKF